MSATEITLDAIVLRERIREFVGRTVWFTSHGTDFRGELTGVSDLGWDIQADRRLSIRLRGSIEARTGFRTRIHIECRDESDRYTDEFINGPAVADVLDQPHPDERTES